MTKEEVIGIVATELETKNREFALMDAWYQVALRINEKMAKNKVSEENWKLLEKLIFGQSRLLMLANLSGVSALMAPEEFLKQVLSLYEIWIQAVSFIYENYDTLDDDGFKNKNSKEHVLEVRTELSKMYDKYNQQFLEVGFIGFNVLEFPFMQKTFAWTQQMMIGRPVYIEYIREFNPAQRVLRDFQIMMVNNSALLNGGAADNQKGSVN